MGSVIYSYAPPRQTDRSSEHDEYVRGCERMGFQDGRELVEAIRASQSEAKREEGK